MSHRNCSFPFKGGFGLAAWDDDGSIKSRNQPGTIPSCLITGPILVGCPQNWLKVVFQPEKASLKTHQHATTATSTS